VHIFFYGVRYNQLGVVSLFRSRINIGTFSSALASFMDHSTSFSSFGVVISVFP
jgi:hypothetical protein